MTLTHLRLSGDDLDFRTLAQVARVPDSQLSITDDAWARMAHSRDVLDTLIARGETIYGVNTNMGGMAVA